VNNNVLNKNQLLQSTVKRTHIIKHIWWGKKRG
jgi:hypothetical protein